MLSKKMTVLLSLGITLIGILIVLLSALSFSSPGEITVASLPAESGAILAGRGEPGRTPSELLPNQAIDINTASTDELRLLPGIGETIAQAILDHREANGPFERIEAIMEVPGVGPSRFDAIAGNITIGESE